MMPVWLAVRPARGDFLFPGLRGHFSAWGVAGMLRRLARAAGIKGRVNPHSFRHAYARGYLDAGGDLGTLCDILGHSDVMVTKRSYARFSTVELRAKHDKYSPIALLIKE